MTQDHSTNQLTELERDMLDALRAADKILMGVGFRSDRHERKIIRAAIAKAEGRK